jgi:hypothetical protein
VNRRTFGANALLILSFLAAPLSAQVVGHLPSESPYEDVGGRHLAALSAGWILPSKDPAGVGPKSGLMLIGRYDFDVAGPLLMTGRVGLAPGLSRNVKDPVLTGAGRDAGERVEPLLLIDGGLILSLTGNKAWRGLAPRAHGSFGMVTSLNSAYDLGGYRFGPKFTMSWGLSVRGATGGAWEWNADLTHMLWRMQYPTEYTDDGTTADPSILGNGSKNPWNGNLMLSFGITRVFRR